MAEYEITPITATTWRLISLQRDASGRLQLNEFLSLPATFRPQSGVIFQNPILGGQWVDFFGAFNRAGDHHPLADIIAGRAAPNGEQCFLYRPAGERTMTFWYDSIFGYSIAVDEQEFRGEGAFGQALAHLAQ